MTIYEGKLVAGTHRFAIVVGRFNEFVTERLLKGALDGFRRHGVHEDAVDVAWVPGSFEIPIVARSLATSGRYGAIVCLGTVIRGSTAHFEHVANSAASGIARIALDTGVPTIFGVLTTETMEQAIERAGMKAGNKGYESALSAIEMADLLHSLEK